MSYNPANVSSNPPSRIPRAVNVSAVRTTRTMIKTNIKDCIYIDVPDITLARGGGRCAILT